MGGKAEEEFEMEFERGEDGGTERKRRSTGGV